MSSREAGECALKCLVLHKKTSTSMRMYHMQEAATEMHFKVKLRRESRKFTFQVSVWTLLWGYLYPQPVQRIERSKIWSWGPNQNFNGWWICVCSSSLVLISNTSLISGFSAVQFKGLCENRGESCIINWILQNRIQGRKQWLRGVAGAWSCISVVAQVGLHPSGSAQSIAEAIVSWWG